MQALERDKHCNQVPAVATTTSSRLLHRNTVVSDKPDGLGRPHVLARVTRRVTRAGVGPAVNCAARMTAGGNPIRSAPSVGHDNNPPPLPLLDSLPFLIQPLEAVFLLLIGPPAPEQCKSPFL